MVELDVEDQIEVREGVDRETIETVQAMAGKYKHGWETEIETEYAPKGVNEDIVRLISAKNQEPEWMTEWRLEAYRRWVTMAEPKWAMRLALSPHNRSVSRALSSHCVPSTRVVRL